MQRRMKLLLVGVVALATLGMASPARAENCVGTERIFMVCVEPTGGTIHEDCIYTGGDTCQYVRVPGPVITRCGNTVLSC